jgi:hypothetical protein
LFGSDTSWIKAGVTYLKYLGETVNEHEVKHLKNVTDLALLGTVYIAAQISEAYKQQKNALKSFKLTEIRQMYRQKSSPYDERRRLQIWLTLFHYMRHHVDICTISYSISVKTPLIFIMQ